MVVFLLSLPYYFNRYITFKLFMDKKFMLLHTKLLSKAEGFIAQSQSTKQPSNHDAQILVTELVSFQQELINQINELNQNEKDFHSEKEYYKDIFNNQPAGLYRIRVFSPDKWYGTNWINSENPPYAMEFASNRFCEIMGVSYDEFAANPFIISDLVIDEDKESFVYKNEEANKKFIPFSWEGRLLVKKNPKWVRLESLPRKLPNKDILWTGILYDITERKNAEEELQKTRLQLEDVLEGAGIGTLEWNVQTGKTKFNKIWAQNLGYASTEIKIGQLFLGKNGWKSITHPDDIPYAEEMLKRHFAGELPVHMVDVRMRHKKGHWVWIRQEGKVRTWTADGKPLLMYGVHIDISAQKHAEIALTNLNEQLEALIAERTSELTILNASLKESEHKLLGITMEVEERERNRFSAELHDGMGPLLSTIKLYFQWLSETTDTEKRKLITEKGNYSIEMAIKTARELARGLNSQYLQEVGFVKAISDFAQRINDTNKLAINFDTNTFQRFDELTELMLYRIATELIKNTITYSNATKANIELHSDVLSNAIDFCYSDNGVGFDVDNINENKGIGLLSIRQRVQVLKGTINIESKEGKGMQVTIKLPIE